MKTQFPKGLNVVAGSVMLGAVAVVTPAASAAARPSVSQRSQAPPQNLPGITVQGQPNAFIASDRRLAAVQRTLPPMGTDVPPQVTLADRAAAYLAAHSDPNRLGVEQQDMLLKMLGLEAIWPNPEQP